VPVVESVLANIAAQQRRGLKHCGSNFPTVGWKFSTELMWMLKSSNLPLNGN